MPARSAGESSIGAGTRRVEALVGADAYRFLAREAVLVGQLAEQLKAPREELPERIEGLVARLREAEKELEKLRADQVLAAAGELAASASDVDGLAVVARQVADGTGADDLRKLALDVRGRITGAVVVLVAVTGDRPLVAAAVVAAVVEAAVVPPEEEPPLLAASAVVVAAPLEPPVAPSGVAVTG